MQRYGPTDFEDDDVGQKWSLSRPMTGQNGLFFLHGIHSSEIRFDNMKWNLKVYGKKHATNGFSETSYNSFLLGKSDWHLSNDTDSKTSAKMN